MSAPRAPRRITAIEELLRLLGGDSGLSVVRTLPPVIAPLGDDDMFFVDAPSPGNPLRMRMRDYGGTLGFYRTLSAARGSDDDADGYLDLRPDTAELGALNYGSGSYAFIIVGPDGAIVEDASLLWEADVDGTDDSSKHRLEGGWGLVLPVLSADPDAGASEARQVYYNDVSNTIRWYNGSIWADLGAGGSSSAVVAYAECNTSPATSPGLQTKVPFDTLYDVDANTVGSLPAALGLTYASDQFTADEDGVWIINLGVEIVAAPGTPGELFLATPDLGYSPFLPIAASGNATTWHIERTIPMHAGDVFALRQSNTDGSPVVQVDGYAAMVLTRIAGALS